MASTSEEGAALTAGDITMLKVAFANFQGAVSFDWPTIATELGIEAGGQATRKRFKRMCDRIGLNILSAGTGTGGPAAAATPTPSKKRGAAATGAGDQEGTPTKRPRAAAKRRTTKKVFKSEPTVRDEDAEEGDSGGNGENGENGSAMDDGGCA